MVASSGRKKISAVLLAAFEDTGYYTANFSLAEPMGFEKDAGKWCDPQEKRDFHCSFDYMTTGTCLTSSTDECGVSYGEVGKCTNANSPIDYSAWGWTSGANSRCFHSYDTKKKKD